MLCCHEMICKTNHSFPQSLSKGLNSPLDGPGHCGSISPARVCSLPCNDHDLSPLQSQCLDQFLFACVYSYFNHGLCIFGPIPTCTRFNYSTTKIDRKKRKRKGGRLLIFGPIPTCTRFSNWLFDKHFVQTIELQIFISVIQCRVPRPIN